RCANLVTGCGEAATGCQIEAPAMQGAGEDPVGHAAELGEIGPQMRATALHAPAVQGDIRAIIVALVVPVLDIVDAFGRQALEEHVDEFVVLTDPAGPEPQ